MKLFPSQLTRLTLLLTALALPALADPPANDDFANAITVSGATGSTTGTNIEATDEVDEPLHNGGYAASSVWWKWTAPSTGQFTFDTIGSDFDTNIGIYTGSSVDALSFVNENDDDDNEAPASKVTFRATSGTTYYIAVAGYADIDAGAPALTGSIVLNWGAEGFKIGEISIYKGTDLYKSAENGVNDTSPATLFGGGYTSTGTYYVVYDHVNGKSASIYYYLDKEVTPAKKVYQVDPISSFGFQIVPGRLPNTTRWASSGGYAFSNTNPADPLADFLGEGFVSSSVSYSGGNAAIVALSPAIQIIVPRQITGNNLRSSIDLSSTEYDSDLDQVVNLDHTQRRVSRDNATWTDNIDLAKSLLANRDDLIFEGTSYPKGSLINGINQVIKALKATGYVEAGGYNSSY